MLDLIDVTVEYGKKNGEKIVPLKNVNFHLDAGDFITVTGKSGSGKTTFIQVCGGLLTPTSGSVLFRDNELHTLNDAQLSQIRNGLIGFVFQTFNLISYLTALENVALPLVFAGVGPAERRSRAFDMLAAMEIANRAQHYPSELSGGECQRVAISRALITDPALIIADEPTGNLDYETGKMVMDIFSGIHSQRRTAILLVTHNPWVAAVGHRTIKIHEGFLN